MGKKDGKKKDEPPKVSKFVTVTGPVSDMAFYPNDSILPGAMKFKLRSKFKRIIYYN